MRAVQRAVCMHDLSKWNRALVSFDLVLNFPASCSGSVDNRRVQPSYNQSRSIVLATSLRRAVPALQEEGKEEEGDSNQRLSRAGRNASEPSEWTSGLLGTALDQLQGFRQGVTDNTEASTSRATDAPWGQTRRTLALELGLQEPPMSRSEALRLWRQSMNLKLQEKLWGRREIAGHPALEPLTIPWAVLWLLPRAAGHSVA